MDLLHVIMETSPEPCWLDSPYDTAIKKLFTQ